MSRNERIKKCPECGSDTFYLINLNTPGEIAWQSWKRYMWSLKCVKCGVTMNDDPTKIIKIKTNKKSEFEAKGE